MPERTRVYNGALDRLIGQELRLDLSGNRPAMSGDPFAMPMNPPEPLRQWLREGRCACGLTVELRRNIMGNGYVLRHGHRTFDFPDQDTRTLASAPDNANVPLTTIVANTALTRIVACHDSIAHVWSGHDGDYDTDPAAQATLADELDDPPTADDFRIAAMLYLFELRRTLIALVELFGDMRVRRDLRTPIPYRAVFHPSAQDRADIEDLWAATRRWLGKFERAQGNYENLVGSDNRFAPALRSAHNLALEMYNSVYVYRQFLLNSFGPPRNDEITPIWLRNRASVGYNWDHDGVPVGYELREGYYGFAPLTPASADERNQPADQPGEWAEFRDNLNADPAIRAHYDRAFREVLQGQSASGGVGDDGWDDDPGDDDAGRGNVAAD